MLERRELFSSFGKHFAPSVEGSPVWVRPPYGGGESLFQSECPTCENKVCVTSCDEKIIFIDDKGIPTLSFEYNGCTFCDACAEVCPNGVLSLEREETASRLNALFRISIQDCVAHDGVICFACKEPCLDDAILFNGLFNPVIDEQKCTACGFCLARCPAQAITFEAYKSK